LCLASILLLQPFSLSSLDNKLTPGTFLLQTTLVTLLQGYCEGVQLRGCAQTTGGGVSRLQACSCHNKQDKELGVGGVSGDHLRHGPQPPAPSSNGHNTVKMFAVQPGQFQLRRSHKNVIVNPLVPGTLHHHHHQPLTGGSRTDLGAASINQSLAGGGGQLQHPTRVRSEDELGQIESGGSQEATEEPIYAEIKPSSQGEIKPNQGEIKPSSQGKIKPSSQGEIKPSSQGEIKSNQGEIKSSLGENKPNQGEIKLEKILKAEQESENSSGLGGGGGGKKKEIEYWQITAKEVVKFRPCTETFIQRE